MSTGGGSSEDASGGREQRQGLRSLSLRGGAYLAVRESSGIVIRLGGVLLVTRIIGPYDFGLYASAAAFVAVLASVAQLGVEVSLISRSETPTARTYDTAFTFLLVTSCAAVALGFVGTVIVQAVSTSPAYLGPLRLLLVSIPLNICWAPAQARLERRFHYRWVAALELLGDVVLYAVSVSLALTGAGVWAPTIGYIAWQGFLFFGSLWAAGVRPRLAWDGREVRRMARFGGGYGATNALMYVRGLVNPIVVGHFLGPTGVGYVALAQRLVSTLGFVNRAAWRLALVALGRVQHDLARLRRGVEEAMALQVVLLGPLLVGFTVSCSLVVPALFGHAWDPVVGIFGYLAIGDLLATVFLIPQAVLYARGRNAPVVVKQAANLAVLAVASVLLVPPLGIAGFGVAYIAADVTLVLVHVAAQRVVRYRYDQALPWLVAFVPPLCFQLAPWPSRLLLLVPLAVVVVLPATRRSILGYSRIAWSTLRSRATARDVPDPSAQTTA